MVLCANPDFRETALFKRKLSLVLPRIGGGDSLFLKHYLYSFFSGTAV